MINTSGTTKRADSSRSTAARMRSLIAWIGRYDAPIVVALGILMLIVTTLPYIFAYTSSPSDRHFVGVLMNVPDNIQYFSWMRDHRSALLVPNRLTPEPNEPALFNLLWLVTAQISMFTGWSVPVLFHGLRLIAAAGVLTALYMICRAFTRSRAEMWTAYLTIALGAGMGWIWVVEKYAQGISDVRFPFDLYVSEPNITLSIMAFPHFMIASALIMAVFAWYIRALEHRSWAAASIAAALALLLTLQHAYDLLIIGMVPAGALGLILLRDRRIPWFGVGALALVGVLAAPPAIYFTILTSRNPLWREVLDQFSNAGIFTPSPPHLLILFGIPLIIVVASGVMGLSRMIRMIARPGHGSTPAARLWEAFHKCSNTDLFLWSWLLVGFFLLYLPLEFQIHMLNSWQVPVAILAIRIVFRQIMPVVAGRSNYLARALPLILVCAVLPTNLYLIAWRFVDLGRYQAPFFLTVDQDRALTWLEDHTTRSDVVLAGLDFDQFVPARTDARAFVAHWAQTVDYFGKLDAVRGFFDAATSDTERQTLLERHAVTYVVQGPEERSLGTYDATQSPFLELAFTNGDVKVYRVHP